MITAYNESYLNDARENMGDMMDYAVNECGCDPDVFFDWFISTKVADKFENGNPRYVAGMSGIEMANVVLERVGFSTKKGKTPRRIDKSREYWAGWILAYYQWLKNLRFEDMMENGLKISEVMNMYILHEADDSKFVECADKILEGAKERKISKLQTIRKARGFTQQQLSEASGVSLRMIQLYEQKQNDISKAQVNVVISLAKTLGCQVEDLIN
ncbi:MAG: helix-turn-helix transcriptional regulator [Lachnospiraceae bacterium]|nr:helix-turn-helix transcriptional regulator [Lachnospiraceae bacterium]